MGQLGMIGAEQAQRRDTQIIYCGDAFVAQENAFFAEPYLFYRWKFRHLLTDLYPCAVNDFFHLRVTLRLERVDRVKLGRFVCPRRSPRP